MVSSDYAIHLILVYKKQPSFDDCFFYRITGHLFHAELRGTAAALVTPV